MAAFRCQWCGRFFSSELPEASGCPNHILEANEQLRKSIEKHNAKLARPESEGVRR